MKLISTSISSSSCPGGEGLQFSTSPRAQRILAYNSSRMYVIDAQGAGIEVKREFKLLRRPVAACIKDDASLLAVLSTEMQVDLYDLDTSPPRRKHSIILDNSPRTIALSPCGSVLAAAYEGGIEVSSLNPDMVASGKRSVKCDGVDSLTFSFDGTQILGTTTVSSPPSTVILTAPYYDPGSLLVEDDISSMWTTSILFPNSSRDCSHAVLLQHGNEEEACWTFAYDRSFETFRAVRIDDLRNGTTYFTGPTPVANSQAKLLPSTLPGTTYSGDLVSAGFHGKEVWIYGVPDQLDAPPEMAPAHGERLSTASALGRRNSEHSSLSCNASSRGRDAPDGVRSPQWTLLYDKLRNTFKNGSKVSDVDGVSAVRWVADHGVSSLQERLIVAARGVSGPRLATDEEDIDFVDGGRIVLLDFDYGLEDGGKKELTIELGSDDAELLEEEQRDMATEVAIVRRRTVAQQRGGRTALLRAASTVGGVGGNLDVPPVPSLPQDENDADDDPLLPRRMGQNPTQRPRSGDAPDDPDVATIEQQEAMDAPYAHGNPRSAPTLRRAATAAAVNRTLNPRTADGRPIEYRRADGRREHPHESDADNWVPPPPPYQKEDPQDLPAFMKGPAIAPPTSAFPPPAAAGPSSPTSSRLDYGPRDRRSLAGPVAYHEPPRPALEPRSFSSHHRTASGSTSHTRSRLDDTTRPRSSPSPHVEMDDLYDVSPPESPRATLTSPARPEPAQVPSRTPSEPTVEANLQSGLDSTLSFPHFNPDPAPAPAPQVHSSPHNPSPDSTSPDICRQAQQVALQPQNIGTAPTVRRLSNAQTWPAGPSGEAYQQPWHNPHVGGPAPHVPNGDYFHAPLPSSSQLASLDRRISQGHPRRLSGSVYDAGSSTGVYPVQNTPPTWPIRPVTVGPTHNWGSGMDPPLIISTPKGVSGAFDPPDQQQSSNSWSGTPIFAPTPRHPRPHTGLYSPRPTVERLETIYSSANQGTQPRSQTKPRRKIFSVLRRSPSVSPPSTVVGGVNRQPSRAERSAAKNIQDAKKKGWKPQRSKSKKKKKNRDYDVASSAGWTDVSVPSVRKEKKCAVM